MELTNRKLYFDTKKEIEKQGLEISNNEICQLLEKSNNFKNYTELTLNFDKKPANLEYFYQLKEKLFKGMPIQYILKEAPFIDLSLYVFAIITKFLLLLDSFRNCIFITFSSHSLAASISLSNKLLLIS